MQVTIIGTLSVKFEFFGRVVYTHRENVNHSFTIATIAKSFSLPGGLSVLAFVDGEEADVRFTELGFPIFDEHVEIGGTRKIKVEIDSGNEFVGAISVTQDAPGVS